MKRLAALASLVLTLAAGGRLAAEEPSAPRQSDPTPEAIRQEFKALCQNLRDSDDEYFGTAMLARLEGELAGAQGSPESRISIRGRLALEYRRLGNTARSIALLEEALAIAEGEPRLSKLRDQLRLDLGVAHLRAAEDNNCLEHHQAGGPSLHPASACVLPVGPESIHSLPTHTRRAGDYLLSVLETNPDPLARWLLVLSRMLADDYPAGVPAKYRLAENALRSQAPFPRWENVAPELGLDVLDLSGGAVVDDLDGDGLLDVVTSTWDPCGPMKAFRNRGDGTFENVSAAWGLDAQLGGLNLMPADFDNDGDLDLLLLRGAWMRAGGRVRNSLLRNDLDQEDSAGKPGRFVDVTASAGLAEPAYPTQAAAWGDYDGDGDLDLYVGNEATEEKPYPSQLFRNGGDGTFTDVAVLTGVQNFRYAKSAAWGDFDEDGDPDLYVSNMGLNRLYRNDGAIFTDVTSIAGVEKPFKSFASWFFDFDNDGDLDLFVAAYGAPVWQVAASYCCPEVLPRRHEGNPILYRNEGGRFTDVSAQVGLTRPLLPMGSNYGDLDNDGWLDLYLGTGVPDLTALMPNVLLRNDGGKRLLDVTFDSGFGVLQKGHGIAFSDIDNDGDQDVFAQLGGAYPADPFFNALFENPGNDHAWITLELAGTKANRSGVGARIAVTVRDAQDHPRTLHLLAGTGGSFGASALRQEIGLGDAKRIEAITLRWPGSGTVQTFHDVEPNRFYRAVEGATELEPFELPKIQLGKPAATAPAVGTPADKPR